MSDASIWLIALLTIAAIILRPLKLNEAFWSAIGAFALLSFGLLPLSQAVTGILKGTNVYFFLTGMMLLAETARQEKLFEWVASYTIKLSRGSAKRLFILIYLAGILITVFLSNDATAVVLTPAVAATAKSANIKKPLPFLFICAFIANAASFVLPISNPANLVVYQSHLPSLAFWLQKFLLPSAVAIAVTFVLLRYTQRHFLTESIQSEKIHPKLLPGAKTALLGIAFTSVVLLFCSAKGIQMGLPTLITGIFTSAVVILFSRKNPWPVLKDISWSIIPLVACLFIIVEALNQTRIIEQISVYFHHQATQSESSAVWISGLSSAYGSNLLNNLPAGLIMGNVVHSNNFPEIIKRAILVGTDLGPNLSVTGSLATILWLSVLRREGFGIKGREFFKIGIIVMSITLFAVLASLFI